MWVPSICLINFVRLLIKPIFIEISCAYSLHQYNLKLDLLVSKCFFVVDLVKYGCNFWRLENLRGSSIQASWLSQRDMPYFQCRCLSQRDMPYFQCRCLNVDDPWTRHLAINQPLGSSFTLMGSKTENSDRKEFH